jgi:hypothetical protein
MAFAEDKTVSIRIVWVFRVMVHVVKVEGDDGFNRRKRPTGMA